MGAAIQKDETEWLKVVAEQVATLRFGVIQIVVHDRRVVQIDKTEKVRIERSADGAD